MHAFLFEQRVLTTGVTGCQLGKLLDAQRQGFTGSWSLRLPLPCTYPNPKLSKGKQVFRVNHVVCTHSLGIMSRSYQLWNDENSP